MKKFTIFTIILAILVLVIASDIVFNDYLPSLKNGMVDIFSGNLKLSLPENLSGDALQANVVDNDLNKLGADVSYEDSDNADSNLISRSATEEDILPDLTLWDDPVVSKVPAVSEDFEDENFSLSSDTAPSVYLRNEQVKSAGFLNAAVEKEESDGFLYKTILVSDLYDVKMEKYLVQTEDAVLAKVYVFVVGSNSDPKEVYNALKARAVEDKEITINETDSYAQASFFMNDPHREGTAFLTVKFGSLIYGFSYPKEYHSQVKNLIKLIEWEKSQ